VQHNFLRDSALSLEARMVGLLYASFADSRGWAWPSVKSLMSMLGIGQA
jgi:hypothetical protein